ncbi:AzlC family ABC transporter permease [Pseudoalteromonas citrea]|nr:AzlC family ABC transporter permease [Pseudoalteromonas citrea]
MQSSESNNKYVSLMRGALAVFPLALAVVPWGILAGSYAIEVGLTWLQAQAMSAIVFAGAAQLAALGMLASGIGVMGILLTTTLITSRHLLYSLSLRPSLQTLPTRWRITLGFLLTDEMFAIVMSEKFKSFQSNPWFALGAGGCFYVSWNLATTLGIVLGTSMPELHSVGLDFAIVATFIALIVPSIKTFPVLVCVGVAAYSATVFALVQWQAGLLLSSGLGMLAGYVAECVYKNDGKVVL